MRILIVGGGLAGLFNGYSLFQKKHDIVILEKTAYLGGELRTLSYTLNGLSRLGSINTGTSKS